MRRAIGRCLVAFVGCILISGCGGSEGREPVEITNTDYGTYYTDSVVYSSRKDTNYSGYFLADGISLETALDLSALDGLVYGWEWSVLDETYTGGEIVIPEEDQERLDELELAREEELEAAREAEANAVGDGEAGVESAEQAVGGIAEGSDETGDSLEAGSAVDEILETPIGGAYTGSVTTLAELDSIERVLYPGQVLEVTPVFVYTPVEEKVSGEPVLTSEGEATVEGDTGEVVESESGESVAGDEPIEEELPEPKEALLSGLRVVNYLDDRSLSVAECISREWYTVAFDNYAEVFSVEPESGESFSNDIELFESISEVLGHPTSCWERDMGASDYVAGLRVETLAYEFPEYTFFIDITEDGTGNLEISSIEYCTSSLWLEGSEFVGLRMLYTRSDIEIVHDVIPTVAPENAQAEEE